MIKSSQPRFSRNCQSVVLQIPAAFGSTRNHSRSMYHQARKSPPSHRDSPVHAQLTACQHTYRKQVLAGAAPFSMAGTQAPFSNTAAGMPAQPLIHDLFEPRSGTWQYIIADPSTLTAAIVDPVLGYDQASRAISTHAADSLLALIEAKGYTVDYILETHAHADHITAASYLQSQLAKAQDRRPVIGIGKRIGQVQRLFGSRYGITEEELEGSFDKLFEDDESFLIGKLEATAIHLPGHTPDHLGYRIGDNVFCGDSLFHTDIGTARCDFPGGSADDLFQSGRKMLQLPDDVAIWTGHDYPPDGRGAPVSRLSVREQKLLNKHVKDGVTKEEFVKLRNQRDAKLGEPRLLHESLQLNIRGGRLQTPTKSGHRMLHLPLKLAGVEW